MDATSLVWLLVLAGAAAYVQTLTGFALGLLMMGAIALLGIMPLPIAAVIVGILTLVNTAQVLIKGWRDVAWPEFRLVIVPSLLSLCCGYFLLEYLAGTNLELLRLLLGLVIIGAGIRLSLQPKPLEGPSSPASFVLAGALGGFLGGMFSTSGPPVIYHLYRQPLPLGTIRATLMMIFAVNGLTRLGLVTAAGRLPSGSEWWSLLTIPVVIAVTYVARRWPPPLAPMALRRLAFFFLLLSGLALALPVTLRLLGLG